MASRRYTVLRRPRPVRGRLGARSFGDRDEGTGPELTFENLDDKQAAEMRLDPDALLARGYRARLIRPLGARDAAQVPDWGLDAVGATASSMTGNGVVVAVLDTGIDRSHEAFAAVDVVEEDFSGCGNGDREGHGTHCAGTIFGGEVGGRRIGVAPGVRRALIGKILDDKGAGDAPSVFAGIRWAMAQGAHVISMSVGFDFPGEVAERVADGWAAELATSEALEGFRENLEMLNALMTEISAGRSFGTNPLVVAAAGNESRRNERLDWRISASLPAAAVHLPVAALQPEGAEFTVAPFSNSKARVAAPGVDIVSARVGGGLLAESGTSMACPFVAGVAALWAEKLGRAGEPITATDLQSHLIAGASRDRLVRCGVDDVGRGLISAPC